VNAVCGHWVIGNLAVHPDQSTCLRECRQSSAYRPIGRYCVGEDNLRDVVTAALASVFFVGGATFAAEEPSSQKDLSAFLCKDVMCLSGSERENALALVHGYRLGKKNTTQYEIEALATITDKFIDHCLDNPGDQALAAFEKIAN